MGTSLAVCSPLDLDLEGTEGVTFSRALGLTSTRIASADDAYDAALLDRAKERAYDPAIFDQYPPYFFEGEISSGRWDSYDTRMAPSTLRNFAGDAEAGVAFLRNHNQGADAIGASLAGLFVQGNGGLPSRTRATFYALSDPDTAPYLAKIQAGVVRDLSVGFYGGQWLCSLCNRDMMQWFGPDGCPHLLGVAYTPRDEDGNPSGDAEVARATIEGAHLAEVSGVYDGATPGAMIGKARSLAAEGVLHARARGIVEQRYRVYLPEPARRWAGVELPEPVATTGRRDATPEEIVARAMERVVNAAFRA